MHKTGRTKLKPILIIDSATSKYRAEVLYDSSLCGWSQTKFSDTIKIKL